MGSEVGFSYVVFKIMEVLLKSFAEGSSGLANILHTAIIVVLTAVYILIYSNTTVWNINSVALVRERTIPTERPPPVGEISANFCG